jgi:hypothetical protein
MTTLAGGNIRLAPGASLAKAVETVQEAAAIQAAAVADALPQLRARAVAAPMAAAAPPATSAPTYLTRTGPQPDLPLDAVLYESSARPGQKFFIAQYRLASSAPPATDYLACLRKDGQDWVLDVPLERFAADSLGAQATGAQPIDAIARVTLVYTVDLGEHTVQRSLQFQEVLLRDRDVLASLRVSTPPDQDELYDALSARDGQGRLTVWRQLSVQVPKPLSTAEVARLTAEMHALSVAPLICMRASEMGGYLAADGRSDLKDQPTTFVLENLSGHDTLQSGDKVRLRTPGGGTCLAGVPGGPMRLVPIDSPDQAIRDAQQMMVRKIVGRHEDDPIFAEGGPVRIGDPIGISFFLLKAKGPDSFMAQRQWDWAMENAPDDDADHHDRAKKQQEITSLQGQIDSLRKQYSTTEFQTTDASLPLQVKPVPFYFRESLHRNFYRDVTPSGAAPGGLARIEVNSHVYYQDLSQRQRFYYLPDRFELQAGPAFPNVRIRATTDIDKYLIEYVAAPVVDPDRLHTDEAQQLLAEANRLAPTPFAHVEFEPLLGDLTSLSLMVPLNNDWSQQARPNTISDLYHPFNDVLALNAEGLRRFWDALFAPGDLPPFRGKINVSLGVPDAWAQHQLDFVGRVPAPAAEPARSTYINNFWTAAFDATVPATFLRRIDVVADQAMFATAQSVAVSFELGGVVMLTPQQLRGFTDVGQPIGDYVLNRADAGTYRYKLTVSGGKGGTDTQWRQGNGSTLTLRTL